VKDEDGEVWTEGEDGKRERVDVVWEKMSKSKRNGVDPDSVISRYGADTVRLFILFKAPPEKALDWDERAIQGQVRWLGRLYSLLSVHTAALGGRPPVITSSPPPSPLVRLQRDTAAAVRDVTAQLNLHLFNVAIALLMKYSNALSSFAVSHPALLSSFVFHDSMGVLARMLAPFAPHSAAEMWMRLREGRGEPEEEDVHQLSWPEMMDRSAAEMEADTAMVEVSVVVGGKRIASVLVDDNMVDGDEMRLESLVREDETVGRALEGKTVSRVLVKRIRDNRSALISFIL